jgi:hypothetical protein
MKRRPKPMNPRSKHFVIVVVCAFWFAGFETVSIHAQDTSGSKLTATPARVVLHDRSDRARVIINEIFADGSACDLTSAATFQSESSKPIVEVSSDGVVSPLCDGETTIVAKIADRSVRIPVRVEGSSRIRPASFRIDVVALLSKSGCNMGTCHGNLNGKGGFRLSLRGDDPAFDLRGITRDASGRRVNSTHPNQSLIVLKPTGLLPHEGGRRFGIGSTQAKNLIAWIASGARDDVASAAKVKRLNVYPSQRIVAPKYLKQQLIVIAEFDNGIARDVTSEASYDVADPTKVSVSAAGLVETREPGETTIAVRYLQGRGVSRLAFLADRPDFSWPNPPVVNFIDKLVFKKLKALRIAPSPLATDSVFLRRAYLDAIGTLPEPAEARAFLTDRDPDKRSKLVDQLIRRPEFADFWALKWADLLRNEEKTMGKKGVWIFERWLRDQIDSDVPLDVFARSIITAKGSTWRDPAANFYRTNRDPATAAETVGQVFLGYRLQCARCHNHPFDVWTQNDYYGLAAYFAAVKRKDVNNVRKDDLDKHEINGDEIVYLEGPARMLQPGSGAMLEPKVLGDSISSAKSREIKNEGVNESQSDDVARDARIELARRLTIDDPQFARNMANRVWFHLTGRGIVDPVDDFRDSNPPSNPELLDALAESLKQNGMRLRPLVATIMKSRVYQLDSRPEPTNATDEANFARAQVKLLPAEVLLDSVASFLDRPHDLSNAPRSIRAVQFPGVDWKDPFLRTFGKPDRLLTCECERSESTTLAQAFQLINGKSIRAMLEAESNRIGRLIEAGGNAVAIVDELYLASLARFPTDRERAEVKAYVESRGESSRRRAWEDVAWAIINSKEFLLRH